MTMIEAHTVDIGHTQQSSLREKVLEHLFVGELLRSLWCKGIRHIGVVKAEGHSRCLDLGVGWNGVTRYIQLKATRQEGRRQHVDINVALAEKPGGCVIWFWFDE